MPAAQSPPAAVDQRQPRHAAAARRPAAEPFRRPPAVPLRKYGKISEKMVEQYGT